MFLPQSIRKSIALPKTRSRAGFRVNPVMSSKTQTFLFDYSEH